MELFSWCLGNRSLPINADVGLIAAKPALGGASRRLRASFFEEPKKGAFEAPFFVETVIRQLSGCAFSRLRKGQLHPYHHQCTY